jgi:hypothetical protein
MTASHIDFAVIITHNSLEIEASDNNGTLKK